MPARKAAAKLSTYEAKRDFEATPEPSGRGRKRAPKGGGHGLYVVQKHHARNLHYDFRLEHDGVLLSWAVPKGPSLDPSQRRLAVEVEDHPLDYAGFEGVIPEGNYGAGKVEIFDRGRWEPDGDVDRSLRRGRLDFRLLGGKLAGAWHLVRMADKGERSSKPNWLLFRGHEEKAAPSPAQSTSAKVRKRSSAKAPGAPARRSRFAIAGPAGETTPEIADLFELATLVDAPPEGAGWVHETKWDGYRMIAALENGRTRIWSRSGADWSARLPEIVDEIAGLPAKSAIVDGELVSMSRGVSGFQSLQGALGEVPGAKERDALRFVLFDLLTLDGEDLRATPLLERKQRLSALLRSLPRGSRLAYSAHRSGRGAKVLAAACERGLEGIISKRADAPYRSGRGRDWLKSKCHGRQELVVVGYTRSRAEGSAQRGGLGALVLAVSGDDGKLVHAGRVGTGFDAATRAELERKLAALEVERSPLADPVAGSRDVRWVKPRLVAEVRFTEWTADGRLRHPSFVGLREDKPASAVRREGPPRARAPRAGRGDGVGRAEPPEASEPVVAGVTITHPERELFPEVAFTKLDLARYFDTVWPWMEPHLRERPLAFVRCPEGARAACFFQKHWPRELAGVVPVDISEPGEREEPHARIATRAGLVGLAQHGVIEIHLWGARYRRLERPDRIVFDLDPGAGVAWREVVAGARLLRELLRELGLESFPMLTGGKGVHVVAPLTPKLDWTAVKGAAEAIARALAAGAPERYVAHAAKSARDGKIFVDYLRNGRGATAIAPYSPRARAGAPVATPITWEELARAAPDRFDLKTLPRRLAAAGGAVDPWPGYFDLRQTFSSTALARLGLSARASHPSRRPGMATQKKSRYGDKAGEKVAQAMREMKRGELKSGGSGKTVRSRKQAIAIGLSEAREAGGKVPPPPKKRAAKKSAKKATRTTAKRAAPKRAARKK